MTTDDREPEAPSSARTRALSARGTVPSFIAMDVMREAALLESSGRSVIHMEVGQPATSAPKSVLEAAERALTSERLGYTDALGKDALRERIAESYRERHGLTIAPERVVVCTGSSAGFLLAFLAVFDAGDAVALPSPGYPCYRHILSALGCRSPLLETGPETRFMPTLEGLARLDREHSLKGLLVASPANPTGTVIEPERQRELVRYADEHGLWYIADEIYHGLTYGAQAETALACSDEVIVINGFSKYHAMTGFRVGFMVVPPSLVRVVERLQQNLFIAAPTLSQLAALAALDAGEELEKYRKSYAKNRALLLESLPALGLSEIAPADGAFYLYADVSAHTDDSRAFAAAMLEEIGVAVTPGLDFDEARGHRFIRLSYAGAEADMREAVRRLEAWPRLKKPLCP